MSYDVRVLSLLEDFVIMHEVAFKPQQGRSPGTGKVSLIDGAAADSSTLHPHMFDRGTVYGSIGINCGMMLVHPHANFRRSSLHLGLRSFDLNRALSSYSRPRTPSPI
jgi:hypothetical protein